MKSFLASLAASAFAIHLADASAVPVTFTLAVDPAGVALQFDVQSDGPVKSVGAPLFAGASAHSIRSATLESGAHRFVIYSLDGAPISATGTVTVSFAPSFPLEDGALSIANVTATNASGATVAAAPNALPTLTSEAPPHRSIPAGETFALSRSVVDLDGALTNLVLMSGASEVDSAAAAPFSLEWGPIEVGAYSLSLQATDDRSQTATISLGTLQAYLAADIIDYSTFAATHFGAGASEATIALTADPYGTGIRNGLAFLLGLDPHAPDFSRLPKVTLEQSGGSAEMVVRFQRRAELGSLQWSVRQSDDLAAFAAVEANAIAETDAADGLKSVEIRLPLSPDGDVSQFLDLGVSQE